jgi:hypothetical protein
LRWALHARGRLDRLGRWTQARTDRRRALQALSCTFIPARLSDNRFLRDSGYGRS